MVPDTLDNDVISFREEAAPEPRDNAPVWRVLIVDDEPDVHQATLLALKGMRIEGRPLAFVHAYSASEARSRLSEHRDLAVVLLDVVMESEDAGLKLVRFIRETLGDREVRILLRTGQPGYAPEIETIRLYDINDYRTKSELTRVRLFTCLTVAIRSFWQIHQLDAHRRGLELIVAATNDLSKPKGLRRFAEGVVTQLCALLGVDEEGMVCAAAGSSDTAPYVLAAAGRYSDWMGRSLTAIPDARVRDILAQTLRERRHHLGAATCLYFTAPGQLSLAAFVDAGHSLGDVDYHLLRVFCGNISVAFENTQLLQRISDLAFEDPLLGIPNRNRFLTQIDHRTDDSDMLALVDIDGFADINSVLDPNFGDSVLRVVTRRLTQVFSPEAQIARIGSDVFGLFGPRSVVNAAGIEAAFSEPFEVGDESLRLSATSGLANLDTLSPVSGGELLKHAGVALKQAKMFNRGKAVYFKAAHATAARKRMQMLSRLRLAFSEERLFLVYQPFVNLATGRIVGAEALLRWRIESGEYIAPDSFIPLAEQSGLMVPIGDWVTRSALRFLKRLADLGHHDFRMAINVSHVQFREPDCVEKLVQAIRDEGVQPGNIEIELTESVAIDNIHLIERKLSAVRAAGVAIAIDDFGTGYSSLNVLHQLNLDRLKIDRAFISGAEGAATEDGIAGLVLRLADQLGLKTIAEGIETQAQLEKMRNMGCHDGQGYLFSEPLTSDQFEALLQSHRPDGPA